MPKSSELDTTTTPTGSEWFVVVKDGVTSKVELSVLKQYVIDQLAAEAINQAPPTAMCQEGSSDLTDMYSNHHPVAEYLGYTDRTRAWVADTYPIQGAAFIAKAKTVMPERINTAIQATLPSFTGFTDSQVADMLDDADGSYTTGPWTMDIQYQDFAYGHTDALGWHGGYNVTITVVSYQP
jgi:hypothetical protein